ncbi:MAG: hypothetical protein V1721_03670 [Pseudomonadota bacterium]
MGCLTFSSAQAQVVEGCNPLVMTAMKAKAQAQVAYDVAVISQLISQPDSVLAMSCFNQAANISAKTGGSIFSGDFTVQLTPIITPALQSWYGDGNACGFVCPNGKGNGNCYGNRKLACGGAWVGNFANAIGFQSGTINYAVAGPTDATILETPMPAPPFNCTGMADLWDLVRTEGIETGAPFATFNDLVNGVAGAYPVPVAPFVVGDDFMSSWDASAGQNVFSDLNLAIAALPTPGIAPWIIPDFSVCKTSADVLALADLGVACP